MFKVDPKLMKYFKNHEYGAEIIMVSLYMKGRYSLSYREREEIGGVERTQHRSRHSTKMGSKVYANT
ncbi:IS6 family transposase [Candidatus Bandiella woodruffii]|uniref:IS6 family transposase n=1 Tax=Candidatus Bandiella euplotis TaxID=1664265 RepID=A0ABZ0UN39_9RICK|nr:IS6 family transposase [Candidatus Bandiella woodruffii]